MIFKIHLKISIIKYQKDGIIHKKQSKQKRQCLNTQTLPCTSYKLYRCYEAALSILKVALFNLSSAYCFVTLKVVTLSSLGK